MPIASSIFTSAAAPWIALVVAIAVLLIIDLFIVRGRGGEMSLRQAAIASVVWIGIAFGFFGILLAFGSGEDAKSYLAGYLVEKSLSLDNVFVFLLVFTAFAVPINERHRLLTYGIVGALVLRLAFIIVGAAALNAFSWVGFVFAAILIWTGWKMFVHRHDHDAEQEMVQKLAAKLPVTLDGPPGKLSVKRGGKRLLTAAGAALVAIAIVDVIFAIDSVPAILAITSDAYIVFAANAFALLGLRPLFFLVAELVERLYYLKTALAALLIFIGLKLVAAEFVGKIGPEISLPVIAAILGVGVVASLVRNKRNPHVDDPVAEAAHAPDEGESGARPLAGAGERR